MKYNTTQFNALKYKPEPKPQPVSKPVLQTAVRTAPKTQKAPRDLGLFGILSPSMLGIMLCCICLVGSTWAWYHANQSTGVNSIVASRWDVSVSALQVTEAGDRVDKMELHVDMLVPYKENEPVVAQAGAYTVTIPAGAIQATASTVSEVHVRLNAVYTVDPIQAQKTVIYTLSVTDVEGTQLTLTTPASVTAFLGDVTLAAPMKGVTYNAGTVTFQTIDSFTITYTENATADPNVAAVDPAADPNADPNAALKPEAVVMPMGGMYQVQLVGDQTGGTKFRISMLAHGGAQHGYCLLTMVDPEDDDTLYRTLNFPATTSLEANVTNTGEYLTSTQMDFYVTVYGTTTIMIEPHWGTYQASASLAYSFFEPEIVLPGAEYVIGEPTDAPQLSDMIEWVEYHAMDGDTVYTIAAAFGTTPDIIVALNHLPSADIVFELGDRLRVPNPEVYMQQPPVQQQPIEPTVKYRVVDGDTLWDIAQKFGITLEELLALNPNLPTTELQTGDKLNVPNPALNPNLPPVDQPEQQEPAPEVNDDTEPDQTFPDETETTPEQTEVQTEQTEPYDPAE